MEVAGRRKRRIFSRVHCEAAQAIVESMVRTTKAAWRRFVNAWMMSFVAKESLL
jgi:hypothetical protein